MSRSGWTFRPMRSGRRRESLTTGGRFAASNREVAVSSTVETAIELRREPQLFAEEVRAAFRPLR